MESIKQKCRSKHQVLVHKCYPRHTKNALDVKPNSSELSYLLYYASTRRSKLQKVAEYLHKKTVTDVSRGRIGAVQVTLQILKAIIEKCPRDLPLYSTPTLQILKEVLVKKDITLVESTIPTFDAFCQHQDPAILAAEKAYITQYEEIVQLYADFASKDMGVTDVGKKGEEKHHVSWPVAVRFRRVGLEAIRSVTRSDSLASETGRQLSIIIPVILLNVYSESGSYLTTLEEREQEKEDEEKMQAIRRRQSTSTVRTADTGEGDPNAAAGTTEDADRLAEEEVGITALQGLRHLFMAVSRGQLRQATSSVLKFIANRVRPATGHTNHSRNDGTWATTLMAMICGWAPVQDRYTILVAAVETLVRSPIMEEDLEKQLILADIIGQLLGSTINFIGLSVMDVLLGLIQHTLLLLQLGGEGSTVQPHGQQQTGGEQEKEAKPVVIETSITPSSTRIQLLDQIQKCMANLATHVYYTDQVSDMVAAILIRLKPTTSSSAGAIEDPNGTVDAIASAASLNQNQHTDGFFSFDSARLRALVSVKQILVVANNQSTTKPSSSSNRCRVGVSEWEGTQWLLRDPSGSVRKAYFDALLTWLNLELKKADLRLAESQASPRKPRNPENDTPAKANSIAKRAVSNASRREKSPKRAQSTFLKLLHLAIYENAHHHAESEPDMLMLHLLLSTLVSKLGVNSVSAGLPMIMRLQEDIPLITNPAAKISIGSIVHGYFWALSLAFDFETSKMGREIHAEISRRRSLGLWLPRLQIPAAPLRQIDDPSFVPPLQQPPTDIIQTKALKPFDNRNALVDEIAAGYSKTLVSPPTSPPSSPDRDRSRSFAAPVLPNIRRQSTVQPLGPPEEIPLPPKIRDQLMLDWTKESCIANTNKDSSSSGSITGSKGTGSLGRGLLGVGLTRGEIYSNGNGTDIAINDRSRPTSGLPPGGADWKPGTAMAAAMGGAYNSGSVSGNPSPRRASAATPQSSSSVTSAVRVEDLKHILSSGSRTALPTQHDRYSLHDRLLHEDDTGSESIASADFSVSEMSFLTANGPPQKLDSPNAEGIELTSNVSTTPRPLTASTLRQSQTSPQTEEENVPPVPPIPESVKGLTGNLRTSSVSPDGRPRTAPGPATPNGNGAVRAKSVKSTKSRVTRSGSRPATRAGLGGVGDVLGLLDSISADGGAGVGRKPPY